MIPSVFSLIGSNSVRKSSKFEPESLAVALLKGMPMKASIHPLAQLAHDLRSPLSALGCVAESAHLLPEAERRMLLAAVERLQGIANGLLTQQPSNLSAEGILLELCLPLGAKLIVVDDDPTIHELWRKRLSGIASVNFFSDPDQIRPKEDQNVFYLVDYHFEGKETNGLDLIESMGISSRSVLVTSFRLEERLTDRCRRLEVKFLSKDRISTLPIRRIDSAQSA